MIPTTCPPPCSLLTPLFGSFSSFQSIDPTKSPAALQISHKLFPVPDQLSTQLLRRKFLSILWSLLYLFIQFWLCWVCCRMGCSLVAVCGLLIAVVSLMVPGLQSIGSIIAAHLFPDQGLNLCLLHWQWDSLPLSYREAHFRSPFLRESHHDSLSQVRSH